eukprot:TRINITY_DN346_c0_g2_i1.p1 TRINITY_DN346_c0_g2~~TRINITY_DN346_c0_g2_i1.p1  ORF type:complete len:609 (+),score=229.08 TRINITY_DN346_c0_g2_i1:1651-3477(+)
MSNILCPQCDEKSVFVEYDGSFVCESCGYVADDTQLRADAELESVGGVMHRVGTRVPGLQAPPTFATSSAPRDMRNALRNTSLSNMTRTVSRLSGLLSLSQTLRDQLHHQAGRALQTTALKFGRGRELVVASCAYVVCRHNRLPVSMLDVADKVPCNVFELGAVYSRLKAQLQLTVAHQEPELFVEKAVRQLGLPAPHDRTVMTQAVRLLSLAKDNWLDTSRLPLPLAAAAIAVVCEGQQQQVPGVASLDTIAATMHAAPRTVLQRSRELKQLLLGVAQQARLPWLQQDVSVRTIGKLIPTLLDYLELQHRCCAGDKKPSAATYAVASAAAPPPSSAAAASAGPLQTPPPRCSSSAAAAGPVPMPPVDVVRTGDRPATAAEGSPERPTAVPQRLAKRHAEQCRRAVKVSNAVQRLAQLAKQHSAVSGVLDVAGLQRDSDAVQRELHPPPGNRPTMAEVLDDEDVAIEQRLLLHAARPAELVFGPPRTAAAWRNARVGVEGRADLDSEELTEADVPDDELCELLRAPAEAQLLARYYEQQVSAHAAATAASPRKRKRRPRTAADRQAADEPTRKHESRLAHDWKQRVAQAEAEIDERSLDDDGYEIVYE